MRDMSKRLLPTILVLSLFFVSVTWVPTLPSQIFNDSGASETTSPVTDQSHPETPIESEREDYGSVVSAGGLPQEGVLNPILIEQTGYSVSGNLDARTDTLENTAYDLPIDTIHYWKASDADVTISNLTRLYVVNGTFDEGIPGENVNPNGTVSAYPLGWGSSSATTDIATTQRSTYEQIGSYYVGVENEGKSIGTGSNLRFQHALGSEIIWNQSIDNSPYAEEFIFSVDYLYQRGPLDIALGASFALEMRLDSVVYWSLSLPSLAARDQWYSSGDIAVSVPGAASAMTFEIGLSINITQSLNPDDYGYIHANYITAHLDNVVLKSSTAPDFAAVNLEFHAGSDSTPVTGSLGDGSATIYNPLFWTSPLVTTSVTSNTSVSFVYESRLFSHRFTNSSYTTDVMKPGVAFSTSAGLSSDLTLYTYIGFFGDYVNPGLIIRYPSDWDNATVFDPSPTDVTGSCVIDSSSINVSSSILDRLGWWQIQLESPNYAKSIHPQLFDGIWSDASTFRIGNITRGVIEIGTATQTPVSLTGVNITWFDTSNQIWNSETQTGAIGQVTSGQYTFNSGSSPAGEWWLEVHWTNGTEIAYGRTRFEVHHSALLVGDPIEISADTGEMVTGLVRYTDSDTGAYLTDGIATLVGNWSGGDVTFVANPTHNWWEGDFDTSLSGEGDFVVVVNATRSFYDPVSCEILIHSVKVTRLNSPNAPWSAAEWGDLVPLTFNFESYNFGTGMWGPILNESDITVTANWTSGHWTIVEDVTPGVFTLTLNTSANDAGTWLLNTTFNKPHHESKTVLLTLIVSPATSSLLIMEGISKRVDLDEPLSLTLRYLDYESAPITGANVIVDDVAPSTGLDYTLITEVGGEPGNYSITLTPRDAGVFTVRFLSSKQNSENATAVFVIAVNDVATNLDIPGTGSVEIGLTDVYNTTFRFEMWNGTGVSGAMINVTYTGGALDALTYGLVDKGLGDYSIEFTSTTSGTYLVTIAAFKDYHQSDSDAFFLIVREISTNMTSLNGTADLVGFGKDYRLFVSYTNSTGHGLVGANISIENVVPEVGLSWDNTTAESPGVYSNLLTPLDSNTFTLLVQATLPNHQTQFVLFTLTATAIATSLSSLNTSTTISLDQNFTVTLLFQDEDLNVLDGGTLTIQNPPIGVEFSEFDDLGSGYYHVTLTPLVIGTFDVIFKASKSGYQNGYVTFTLGARRIPTTLKVSNDLTSASMIFSQGEYDIPIFFERADLGLNVSGATIDVHSVPDSGFSWTYIPLDDGYLVTIIPERIGSWTLTIDAHLDGYSTGSVEFSLDVRSIPIHVELLSSNSVVEGRPFELLVNLTEEGTATPIVGAEVSYRLSLTGAGEFFTMQETGTPGIYSAQHFFPLYLDDSEYLLEIRINKDNYFYPDDIYSQPFFKTISIPDRMGPIIAGGSAAGASLIALLIVGQIYRRRRKSQIAIDVANKRRFDDADNVIGVIVMHKASGIPVYSRIVKGGFEEGIVAAFISAVTHFREEFEMLDEEVVRVVPISDIIRAVQTRNLICAFVTVRSASIDHNRKMEAYAMQVGTYLDDLFDGLRPSQVLDEKVTEMLDYIYETTMDGHLNSFYKIATSDKFPRRYRSLEELMIAEETKHCSKPILLARGVAKFGVSESRGCTLVLEAIQKQLIIQCEDEERLVSEINFAEYLLGQEMNGGSS